MSQIDRTEGLVGNTGIKAPVRCATTANITLSGYQTIDGVVLAAADGNLRVLVKDQTDTLENGLYDADSGDWSLCQDADGPNDWRNGSLLYVTSGTTNTGFWYASGTDPIEPGTDVITFARASTVLATVSAFMQTVLDDATAAAARTTLGAVGLTGNETVAGVKTFSSEPVFSAGVTMNGISVFNAALSILAGSAGAPSMYFGGDTTTGLFRGAANQIGIAISGVEKARVDSSGNLLVGKTATGIATAGAELQVTGQVFGTIASAIVMVANRLTDDGTIISIRQDSTEEGTISVSGNTVSYNAFLGSHWSQLEDGSRQDLLPGTILDSVSAWCVWPGEENDRLPRCKVSDQAASTAVYGVFLAWDDDAFRMEQETREEEEHSIEIRKKGENYVRVPVTRKIQVPVFTEHPVYNQDGTMHVSVLIPERFEGEGEARKKVGGAIYAPFIHRVPVMVPRKGTNDLYCAAIGAYRVRLKKGETPALGDLIEMSDAPGCGRVQADAVIRSSTVAKIDAALVIETYDDGSFTMPATLHCG